MAEFPPESRKKRITPKSPHTHRHAGRISGEFFALCLIYARIPCGGIPHGSCWPVKYNVWIGNKTTNLTAVPVFPNEQTDPASNAMPNGACRLGVGKREWPEPAKHRGRVEGVCTRLVRPVPPADTRGWPLLPPHGVGLFTGHFASAVGTCVFEVTRFNPVHHRRLTVRTDHRLLSRVAHQLSQRFTSDHPRRPAPVTHHRGIA